MVPGRQYNVRYVVRTLRRSWWLLAVPLAITGTLAVVIARTLPDVYYSQGLVRIVPPRIPDGYVKGTVTVSVPERVAAARAQVLAPERLQALITELDIYPTMRHRVPEDVVLSWLRSSIRINVAAPEIFSVGYYGYSRTRSEKVAERLTAMMVEEVSKQRTTLSDNQGQFLDSELEAARKRLEEHEQKVSDYRRRYRGQLPTQVDANLQMLQSTSAELQNTEEALHRDRTRRDEVARELEAASAVSDPPPAGDVPDIADPPVGSPTATIPAGTPAQQLRAARIVRARMARRFTPSHPDMKALDNHIRQLEIAAGAVSSAPGAIPDEAPSKPGAAQLSATLKTLEGQIAAREASAKRLREAVAAYRARVEAVPEREAEWMRLTRDYNSIQTVYSNLLAKREESRLAANVDRQAVGEQVRVIDRPRRPSAPVSPNRRAVVLIGGAIGAGLGLALLVLGELRDRTLRAEEEVLAALNLPVVGLVPRIVTTGDRRLLRRRRLLWSIAAAVLWIGLAALRWNG
jgi:succinoglycan biosynthesis transport protein ExoP